ncbi:hypothetical protein FHS16_003848 [Paenibacillus endophyticus]|uniref:C1q domain-containing protein n=1 Tax=Paenibacillus endophyticus TaxID=1294268 RepID=A0A7W5GBT9_9BACL|nr:hypothetical protein [Paenibacillus endophyticus]MBB3153773.1 hypothetical protein [Paenibacillus endophyticus]
MAFKSIRLEKQVCSKIVCKKTVIKKTISNRAIRRKPVCKRVAVKLPKIRKSAFHAIAGNDQSIMDATITKVRYQAELLDLNNEYNASTSTFQPKQNGIYTLQATILFESMTPTAITLNLDILINGIPRISDQESFTTRTGIIDASGIVQLKTHDHVEVFARAIGESGDIRSGLSSRFEGARIS